VSPERLWLLSISLRLRGHRRLARIVKRLNAALYRNSLPSTATVGSGLELGNRSLGTIVHSNVVIGNGVRISHNVTIAVRAGSKAPYKVHIEDDVSIGTNAVIITPHRADLRIGRGASIGPGAVVSRDVPAGASVLCAPTRTLDDDGLAAPGQADASRSDGES
jgi:serine O-acetyltransferase